MLKMRLAPPTKMVFKNRVVSIGHDIHNFKNDEMSRFQNYYIKSSLIYRKLGYNLNN